MFGGFLFHVFLFGAFTQNTPCGFFFPGDVERYMEEKFEEFGLGPLDTEAVRWWITEVQPLSWGPSFWRFTPIFWCIIILPLLALVGYVESHSNVKIADLIVYPTAFRIDRLEAEVERLKTKMNKKD